jgi:hypothetical protein
MTQHVDTVRRGLLMAGGMALVGVATSVDAAWTSKQWTATEKANVKTVQEFLATLEAGKLEAMVAMLSEDAKVRMAAHQPPPPLNPQGVHKALSQFLSGSSVTFKILETVAQGPIVIKHASGSHHIQSRRAGPSLLGRVFSEGREDQRMERLRGRSGNARHGRTAALRTARGIQSACGRPVFE